MCGRGNRGKYWGERVVGGRVGVIKVEMEEEVIGLEDRA